MLIAKSIIWKNDPDTKREKTTDRQVSSWVSPIGGASNGGDWCDAIPLSDNVFAIVMGDISGHGSGVAEPMLRIRSVIARGLKNIDLASQILVAANTAVYQLQEGLLCTLLVAIVDVERNVMILANAGHPPPLLVSGGSHIFLKQAQSDLPLGIFTAYEAHRQLIDLPSDALIVFYTDGITEHNRDSVSGELELIQAALAVHAQAPDDAAKAVGMAVLQSHRGSDDAAVMCLRTKLN